MDSEAWRTAAVLGLAQARQDLDEAWVPTTPPDQGIESLLIAYVLGLPMPFDGEVELWRASAFSSDTERVFRGVAGGIVPALRQHLHDRMKMYESEPTLVYDWYANLPNEMLNFDAMIEAEEQAEDSGRDLVYSVPSDLLALWFVLRDPCVREGGAELASVLELEPALRARVLHAWVQTDNAGTPLLGWVICSAQPEKTDCAQGKA